MWKLNDIRAVNPYMETGRYLKESLGITLLTSTVSRYLPFWLVSVPYLPSSRYGISVNNYTCRGQQGAIKQMVYSSLSNFTYILYRRYRHLRILSGFGATEPTESGEISMYRPDPYTDPQHFCKSRYVRWYGTDTYRR